MLAHVKINLDGLHNIQKSVKKLSKTTVKIGVNESSPAKNYAHFVEFGWVQAVTQQQRMFFIHKGCPLKMTTTSLYNPPRPFLRATFENEHQTWVEYGKHAFKQVFDAEKGNINQAVQKMLKTIGVLAKNDITKTIATGGSAYGFPPRSQFTIMMYEALTGKSVGGGDKPLTNTGLLKQSIEFELE